MSDHKILVTLPLMPSQEDYNKRLNSIWAARWMTNNGAQYLELQRRLGERMHTENLELYVNGHTALDTAIRAYGLKGEVITTPFTFASTTHALVINGCTPVFCDIKESDYTLDETKLEALITPRTTAIVPVHVYGFPCNTEAIQRIADKHGLKVIYDAAHAFDVEVNGRPVVLEGDCSMLSFHATKVFNTIEGGALIFKEAKYRSALQQMKNFGILDAETVASVGQNAKMNEFAAAMGLCNLELVDAAIVQRGRLVDIYREELADIPGLHLMDYSLLERHHVKYNYAYMPVIVKAEEFGMDRDQLCEELARYNILSRKYFYPIVPDFDCYRAQYGDADVPVARRASKEVVTLPLSAATPEEDVREVCARIRAAARK